MGTRIERIMDPTCAASSSARASQGRRALLRRSVQGWIALVLVVVGSGSALAATAPSFLPPESDYIVKWSQADGLQPASNWDLEITPIQNASGRFVVAAQVSPELSCWAVNVPVGVASRIRLRAISGSQTSVWSATKSVPGPGGSYLVKWYQTNNTSVPFSWDLEVTPVQNPSGIFVVGAQVMAQLTCWGLTAPVNVPSMVRIRSVSGTQVSTWSPYTTVPEPTFAAALLAALAGLGGLGRRRAFGRLACSAAPDASPAPATCQAHARRRSHRAIEDSQ